MKVMFLIHGLPFIFSLTIKIYGGIRGGLMDYLRIQDIKNDGDHYHLFFTAGGINEYKMIFRNGYGFCSGVLLSNGETEKSLLNELEKYSDLDDQSKCKEINDILDEWDRVVENMGDIEKTLNDLIKQDPKYRLKLLF